jgi:hypothetical protein
VTQRRALGLVLGIGAALGALAVVLGHAGLWALVLFASLLGGLAEVGGG